MLGNLLRSLEEQIAQPPYDSSFALTVLHVDKSPSSLTCLRSLYPDEASAEALDSNAVEIGRRFGP